MMMVMMAVKVMVTMMKMKYRCIRVKTEAGQVELTVGDVLRGDPTWSQAAWVELVLRETLRVIIVKLIGQLNLFAFRFSFLSTDTWPQAARVELVLRETLLSIIYLHPDTAGTILILNYDQQQYPCRGFYWTQVNLG